MLEPMVEERTLVFVCEKPGCEYKLKISGQSQWENLISRTVNQKEKNLIIRPEMAKDPTMPREKVDCEKCGGQEAVFLVTSDKEDTKLELVFICTNEECGHHWKKK